MRHLRWFPYVARPRLVPRFFLVHGLRGLWLRELPRWCGPPPHLWLWFLFGLRLHLNLHFLLWHRFWFRLWLGNFLGLLAPRELVHKGAQLFLEKTEHARHPWSLTSQRRQASPCSCL